MITVTEITDTIKWIEAHPIVGTAILGSIGYTIIRISKFIFRELSENSVHVDPTFWSFGKKFRIDAVHKYEPSDDTSGYTQHQHSRPDQWGELIVVNSILNLRHTVIPINKDDVLVVSISRDGKENGKVIYFNK